MDRDFQASVVMWHGAPPAFKARSRLNHGLPRYFSLGGAAMDSDAFAAKPG
jgi:hypothetical protein